MWGNSAAYAYLIKAKQVTNFITPNDLFVLGRNDEKYIGEYKPLIISGQDFIDWITNNVVLPQAPLCDITLGYSQDAVVNIATNTVTFTKNNGTDMYVENDPIQPGVTISRPDNGEFIINLNYESSVDPASPMNTEWNADGWSNLENLNTRVFNTFYDALGNDYSSANIVGKELILKINTFYYLIKFTSWDDSTGNGESAFTYERTYISYTPPIPCRITFSDGTYIDKKPLPELVYSSDGSVNVTTNSLPDSQIGYDLQVLPFNIGYSNTAFVDINYGNDTTGASDSFTKPFQTFQAAYGLYTNVIYLRPGTHYLGTVSIDRSIHIHCDPGVTIIGSFNVITSDIEFRLTGKPNIESTYRTFNIEFASNVKFYADVNDVTTYLELLFVANNYQYINPSTIVFNFNNAYCDIFNGAGIITFRGAVNSIVNGNYMEGRYMMVSIYDHIGKVNIDIKKMVLLSGSSGGTGNSAFWKVFFWFGSTISIPDSSNVSINANLYNHNTPDPGMYIFVTAGLSVPTSHISYTGDIYGADSSIFNVTNSGYVISVNDSYIEAKGTLMNIANSVFTLNNVRFKKILNLTNMLPIINIAASATATINSCILIDETNTTCMITFSAFSGTLNLINTLAKTGSPLFINLATFLPNLNFMSNTSNVVSDPILSLQPYEIKVNPTLTL